MTAENLEVRTETPAEYHVQPDSESLAAEEAILEQAKEILRSRLRKPGAALNGFDAVKDYLTLHLAGEKVEKFGLLLLDTQLRMIAFEVLYTGTIDAASVYPRGVVEACIRHNAAAVIMTHNHPSGLTNPSDADRQLTKRLGDALNLIDVRTVDHIIIGGSQDLSFTSFRERGLM